jgi:integral membrane protein (TIGR00529 family)
VPARDRVLLNYWFRHVWETWWPLYPGIILAASITGLSIGHIALYGLPGMVVMLALGWFFMLRPGVLELDAEAAGEVHERNHGKVLRFGLPLLVAILGAVGMEVGISLFMPSVPFEYGVILALSASILVAVGQNPGSVSIVVRSVTNKHLWVMLGVVASIFIFKDTMQAAGVIRELSELAGGTTALVVSATLLPYLVGLVSGITLAYVGATFPLLTGLLAQAGLQDQTAAYVMLSIFSGFTGIMSSPMHICFVLSCQYFKVDIGGTWRKLVMPCVLLISSGIVYFILLR